MTPRLAAWRLARILVVAVAALATVPAGARALLGPQDERIDPWPHVRVLDDRARTLAVEQAIAARERFEAPRGAYATLGMDKAVAWVRFPVSVEAGAGGTWILDIDYALLVRVDVYLVREARVVRHVTLGTGQPFASRPLRSRSLAAPLELEPGDQEILLRVETRGARLLPMSLERPAAFHARALGEQSLQGALAALGLFLLLYSLAQWSALRESLYLKYALLVVCSTLFSVHFFGMGEMYLWTDSAWFGRHMAGVSALLATTATALFVEDALGEDLSAWLRKALRAVAALHAAAAFAHAVDAIDVQTVAVLMTTTGLTPGLMGLPGAAAQARRGERVGAWFIVSWGGYVACSAVMVGVVTGRIGANPLTLHSFQIGATLDMLIFMRIALLRTSARLQERRRLRQSFGGYVSPAVMEEILQGRLSPETGGEQRYVCLLFSDIRGYTTRTEGMRPVDVLAFLNRYFDGVVAIIHANGGTVVSFMGDGIEALFGAPQRLDNPCEAGFRAARAMLEHLGEVNRRLAADGLAPIDIGIGLHAGEAVLGHIGGRQRHEYAAIGDVTNVAARLEGATKEAGFRIVLSAEVAGRLASRAGLVPLGPMSLKGHTPVEAHGFDATAAGPKELPAA